MYVGCLILLYFSFTHLYYFFLNFLVCHFFLISFRLLLCSDENTKNQKKEGIDQRRHCALLFLLYFFLFLCIFFVFFNYFAYKKPISLAKRNGFSVFLSQYFFFCVVLELWHFFVFLFRFVEIL